MAKKRLGIGMLVMVLVFGMAVVGCGGDSGPSIPTELVGRWGLAGVQLLEIQADGNGTMGGVACTWCVRGATLILDFSGTTGSARWSIGDDGRLTLSNFSGQAASVLQAAMAAGPLVRL